jgi:formimidoylglutamate deiminase
MKLYWVERAWIRGRWQDNVLLEVNASGQWHEVEVGVDQSQLKARITEQGTNERQDITIIDGPIVPGLTNAHSHAFQRAIAGLTERSESAQDDFWSWRQRMYGVALKITPDQLEVIATQLYRELLAGGYTHVCEFNYLHKDPSGKVYADPLEFSMALVRAAQTVGIGLTLLPTLYMRSGFGQLGLNEDQRRFSTTPDEIFKLVESINRLAKNSDSTNSSHVNAGIALHSLRAVQESAVLQAASFAHQHNVPVHIHIAEQTKEVDDCLAQHRSRPVEWLLNNVPVTAHWNLVHATHVTSTEFHGLKERNASIVICPSTEANLGDGIFDFPSWLSISGAWSIGSDSHVTRDWREELRLLEYSQRLQHRQRNIAARSSGQESSAAALFEAALGGAQAATGLPLDGIAIGQRADFCVMDASDPSLAGVPKGFELDAIVFSSPSKPLMATYVGGRCVYSKADTNSSSQNSALNEYVKTMKLIWN